MNDINVNRTYKDHVFRMIFREKEELLNLYNGTDEIEDRTTQRLSDLFIHQDNLEPALECVATVLNINYGHNTDLMNACRKLYEYSYLIKEIRIGQDLGLTLKAAIERAIDTCLEHGILEELLRKERARVTKSLLGQYGFDLHIKSEKRVSYEEGMLESQKRIITNMLSENLTDSQIMKYTSCSQELIDTVRIETSTASTDET